MATSGINIHMEPGEHIEAHRRLALVEIGDSVELYFGHGDAAIAANADRLIAAAHVIRERHLRLAAAPNVSEHELR